MWLLLALALLPLAGADHDGGCFDPDSIGPPSRLTPPRFNSSLTVTACAYPHELSLRDGIQARLDVFVGTGLSYIFNVIIYFLLPPRFVVTVTCPGNPEYFEGEVVVGDAILGAPLVTYEFSITTALFDPELMPGGGGVCDFAVDAISFFDPPVLLARNGTSAACTETDPVADAAIALQPCVADIVAGTTQAVFAYSITRTLDTTNWPVGWLADVTCDADGTNITAGARYFRSNSPFDLGLPQDVVVQMNRDVPVNSSLECQVRLYEPFLDEEGEPQPLREYLTERQNVTCAVVNQPPPRQTAVQTGTCEPLVLGQDNVDALGVDLCRAFNDNSTLTVGVRVECSDERYHLTNGRDEAFVTFLPEDAGGTCRRVLFSVVLTGGRDELRSDAVCSFQGLDSLGQDDTGALTMAQAACTSESVRVPPPPAPTEPPPPEGQPPPTPTNQIGGDTGISTAAAITLAVCALVVAAALAASFYFCCRKPRPVKGVDNGSDKEDDEPLLPTESTTKAPPRRRRLGVR